MQNIQKCIRAFSTKKNAGKVSLQLGSISAALSCPVYVQFQGIKIQQKQSCFKMLLQTMPKWLNGILRS